jgi:hypothetical protein
LTLPTVIFNWTHAPHRPAAPEAFGLMQIGALGRMAGLRRANILVVFDGGTAGRKAGGVWLHGAPRCARRDWGYMRRADGTAPP